MRISNQNYIYTQTSFQAMKPNQFEGIDYVVVRKFKAPVEKFDTNKDFQNWAKELLDKLFSAEYEGRQFPISIYRKMILNVWKSFFEQNMKKISKSEQLLIFSSLIKNLKPTNDVLPPELRPKTLKTTFKEINDLVNKDKEILLDFQNIYCKQLREDLTSSTESFNGWIIIPSKKKDPKNFEDNIMKLQILSAPTWCTKSYFAKTYLSSGDFHIYLENGVPRIGVRFSGSDIVEIQGIKNNTTIPKEYISTIREHIKDGDFYVNEDVEFILLQSEVVDN